MGLQPAGDSNRYTARQVPRSGSCSRSSKPFSLTAADLSLVFLLEHVGGMKIEVLGRPLVLAAELRVAAIADCHVAQAAVHEQVDERGPPQDAVGDQIFPEPVEDRANQRADDDDREPDLRIEVFADVEVRATANRTRIDTRIAAERVAECERQDVAAAPALDRLGSFGRAHGQSCIAFGAVRDNFHDARLSEIASSTGP